MPYFLGEKTPIHDAGARGMISGLSLSHGVAHVWRALLESYAYAIRHHLEVFAQIGAATIEFRASDGGSRVPSKLSPRPKAGVQTRNQ